MKEIIFEKTEKKYYVSTINRCLKEIQRSEVEEIKNYTDTLKSYSDLIISLYVYCANLNDLLNVQAESEMKIPNLLDIDTFSRPNQCVSNALSSFYAFVETCERNFQIFKDGLKQEYYDNHFEYRFVYRLRNFSVHSGLPVSTISCYILRSDGNNSKQTAFCISKNAFCEKEDKKDFRHEVQEKFQDEDAISIVPYLKDVKEVLFAIVEKIICDAADSLKEIGNLFSNYTNGFEERVGMNDLFLEGVGNDRLFFGGSLLLFSRYLSSFVSENDSIHIGDDDVSRETVRELSAYISNLF